MNNQLCIRCQKAPVTHVSGNDADGNVYGWCTKCHGQVVAEDECGMLAGSCDEFGHSFLEGIED